MLELMPAPSNAKPEFGEGVVGRVDDLNSVSKLTQVIVGNSVEYHADSVVNAEMERVIGELPQEVDAFLEVYTKARGYAVAAHFFGMHSWN